MRLSLSKLGLLALAIAPIVLTPGAAHAQAFWTLTLDMPNQAITPGSAVGSVIYTGKITNTGSGADLNLTGSDFFSTTNWNSTLSLQETSSYLDFLNNIGFLSPGQSYTGSLFSVNYTPLTPSSGSTPYSGTFFVGTDGTPNSLGTPFTLAMNSSVTGGAAAPEPSPFLLIALTGGAIGTVQRVRSRSRTGRRR